ncbi:AAA family ATPase [Fervidobacterium islandicum]|uniref:ATP-dependent nuclease n=1 Tax=Fervidobacterium islandicum TaxID=2423 RepID=UPI003A6EDA4D
MVLESIAVRNYRNLDGLEIAFNSGLNFIVGENNIGKTNFLDLLETVFNKNRFDASDFADISKPIEICLQFLPDELEKEKYANLLSSDGKINIKCTYERGEKQFAYSIDRSDSHGKQDNKTEIIKLLRDFNYLRYDPLRIPADELNFYKNRGVGRFLRYLVSQLISKRDVKLETNSLNGVLKELKENLQNLKPFREFGLEIDIQKDMESQILRLLTLKDENDFDIENAGYGVQFSTLIVLSILENLIDSASVVKQESDDSPSPLKPVSILLGIDEPEVHLHPYMQRNLMRYLQRIIENRDQGFITLIKKLFNIERLNGQAIVVTHSPSILLDDYRTIIRFYKDEQGNTKAVSGKQIVLDEKSRKHLWKKFAYIRETLFSRFVIVVEGDTEIGAITEWAKEVPAYNYDMRNENNQFLDVFRSMDEEDLERYGISVISADGKGSVKPICELLSKFKIKCLGIVDKDNSSNSKSNEENLYVTFFKDFETELVESLFNKNREEKLKNVIMAAAQEINLIMRVPESELLGKKRNPCESHDASEEKNYTIQDISEFEDVDDRKTGYIKILQKNKTVTFGKLLGELLDADEIPDVYRNIILEAKRASISTQKKLREKINESR